MKELKIEIPTGYEIDKEKSTFEKIVFREINTKPRSWKEYCMKQAANNKKGYYINDAGCSFEEIPWHGCSTVNNWRNVLPSRELTEAFLAMMQLMSLRQTWIDDWKPDWRKSISCIVIENNTLLTATEYSLAQHVLSFPTLEMAEEFMNCFKDLLEIAKPLI